MPQWIFRGRIELGGAEFYIDADNEEEAIAKAKAGEWSDYDTASAASRNWKINPTTGTLNE